MGHIHVARHVDAPIERVFDFAADTSHTPEWASWITDLSVDRLSGVGQHFDGTGRLLGRDMTIEGVVAEYERPRLVTMEGTTSLGSTWRWRTEFVASGPCSVHPEPCTELVVDYDYETSGALNAVFDKVIIERTFERQFHDGCATFADLVTARIPQRV